MADQTIMSAIRRVREAAGKYAATRNKINQLADELQQLQKDSAREEAELNKANTNLCNLAAKETR